MKKRDTFLFLSLKQLFLKLELSLIRYLNEKKYKNTYFFFTKIKDKSFLYLIFFFWSTYSLQKLC